MQARTANWGDDEWLAVSEQAPCPICASNDGCQVHEHDDFASCRRVPSVWPMINGAWLHRTHSRLRAEDHLMKVHAGQLGHTELGDTELATSGPANAGLGATG